MGGWVGSISELSPVLRLAITIVIDLFLLLLMYLQVRPDPGSKVNGLVMRGSGAITEVSVESARDRILKAVSDVADVVSVEASVKPVRGRAEIEMQVAVLGHDVKLPAKQKEIDRALRQVIDKQLGLQMAGQPRIQLRIHGEPELKPPVIAAPPPVVVPEKETVLPPPVQPLPAAKIETVPDVKPSTGLFGGLGRTEEPKPVDVKPSYDEPIVVKSEAKLEPTSTGFFSGWGRDREDDEKVLNTPVKSESEIEDDIPSPSLASLVSSETAAVVEAEEDSDKEEVVAEDSNKAVKFNLDEELSHSAVDDEPETDDVMTDDELADANKRDYNPFN